MNNSLRSYNKVMLVVASLCLAGCDGSLARVGMMSDDELDQAGAGVLCNAYRYGTSKQFVYRAYDFSRGQYVYA